MSSPIKSTLNPGNVNSTANSPALNDLMSRLQAQANGADGTNPQIAFSQWMEKHALLGDAQGASGAPRNTAPKPAAEARPSPDAASAAKTAEQMLARARLQNAQAGTQVEQAAPQQAHQADKTVRKADANSKPARKEAVAKTEGTNKSESKEERDDDVALDTAGSEASAVVHELTPPSTIQPGDSAGMMAWLASLSHGDGHGKGAAALKDGGDANGLNSLQQGTDGRLADAALQTDKPDAKGAHGGMVLDNALWQSASGQASLTSEALLAQPGRSGAGEPRAEVDALAGLLHGNGLKPAFGGEAAQGVRHESATLPTPLSSPDFAQALSEQVSMWIGSTQPDGSMTAELHLNPAEMGPINVKISLDGQSAQVDFAAAAVETRQAIEASLPLLSSALSDVGLSLTGGDVSSQTQQSFSQAFAQQQSSPQGAQGNRGGLTGDDAGGAEVPGMRAVNAPRSGRLGGLDLYA